MKKLMIAAVVVASAIAANAAKVTWTTGAIKLATDATGAITTSSKTAAKTSGNVTVNASIWYLTEAVLGNYATIADKSGAKSVTAVDSEKLYTAMKAGTLGDAKSEYNNVSGGNNQAAAAYVDTNGTTGYSQQKLYAALLLEYTDATYGDFYLVNAAVANIAASDASVVNLAQKIGGVATGTAIDSWTAVPEPTSGLLLLLGVAGLALRRKQK